MSTTDMPDLDAILLGDEPDYDTDPGELPIVDRTQADRLVRRIAHLDAEHDAEKAAVLAHLDELQWFLERRYETYAAQRDWLAARLRRFHEALLSADDRLKTVKLPAGELRMRVQQPAWVVDGEQYLPWARDNAPETIRTVPATEAVDLRAVKDVLTARTDDARAVTEDGEFVPGVTVTETPPKFSIVFRTSRDHHGDAAQVPDRVPHEQVCVIDEEA